VTPTARRVGAFHLGHFIFVGGVFHNSPHPAARYAR
jgi:hypothetical protein